MSPFLDLVQKTVGQILPVSYIATVCYAVIKIGRFLDVNLERGTRNAYLDYLERGGLKDTSNSVVNVAASTIDKVFGARHFSLRCIAISATFSVFSIAFFIILSGLLSFAISRYGNEKLNHFLELYWSFPFKIGIGGALTWIAWSIVIDFFSLLKTRLLIRLLIRWKTLSIVLCIADFLLGFLIYSLGISLLSILSLALHDWVRAPIVSLETGLVMTMLAVLYGKTVLPNLEGLLASKGQLTPQAIALLHSDAPQTMLATLFGLQFVPFLTIGSDLFYASMMPSIWLWIFIGSVYTAKLASAIGAYFQFFLSRFKHKRKTLEVTGKLLTPIIIMAIFLSTLWPYAIGVMLYVAKIFLAVLGLLANHLKSTIPPT